MHYTKHLRLRRNWVQNYIKSLNKKRDQRMPVNVKDASKINDLVYKKLCNSVSRDIRKAKQNRKCAQFKNKGATACRAWPRAELFNGLNKLL